jgi:hypothetical protein
MNSLGIVRLNKSSFMPREDYFTEIRSTHIWAACRVGRHADCDGIAYPKEWKQSARLRMFAPSERRGAREAEGEPAAGGSA